MKNKKLLIILSFMFLLLLSFVSAYNGDVCNETHSPCGGGCSSTDLSSMYNDYDWNNDINGYGDITGWNTSCINNMNRMFGGSNFNQDISGWDVSNVTDLSWMFFNSIFNQNINSWNTKNVIFLNDMFFLNIDFNQPLNDWDVSKVKDMRNMFGNTISFNYPLNNWNTSSVIDMNSMFDNAHLFNQSINSWNTKNVLDMGYMFNRAYIFNQPLNNLNVSKVTNMKYMFGHAEKFNQSLNSWDVGKVTDIHNIFSNCFVFNQPLNNWNTSSVTDMDDVFDGASSFNQDISNWNFSLVNDYSGMFDLTSISTINYDSLLYSLANQFVLSNMIFSGGNATYTDSTSHDYLTSTKGWVITDDGYNTPSNSLVHNWDFNNSMIDSVSNVLLNGSPSYLDSPILTPFNYLITNGGINIHSLSDVPYTNISNLYLDFSDGFSIAMWLKYNHSQGGKRFFSIDDNNEFKFKMNFNAVDLGIGYMTLECNARKAYTSQGYYHLYNFDNDLMFVVCSSNTGSTPYMKMTYNNLSTSNKAGSNYFVDKDLFVLGGSTSYIGNTYFTDYYSLQVYNYYLNDTELNNLYMYNDVEGDGVFIPDSPPSKVVILTPNSSDVITLNSTNQSIFFDWTDSIDINNDVLSYDLSIDDILLYNLQENISISFYYVPMNNIDFVRGDYNILVDSKANNLSNLTTSSYSFNLCVSDWVSYNSSCVNNTQTILYNDTYSCPIAYDVPLTNGSVVACNIPSSGGDINIVNEGLFSNYIFEVVLFIFIIFLFGMGLLFKEKLFYLINALLITIITIGFVFPKTSTGEPIYILMTLFFSLISLVSFMLWASNK